MFYPVSQPSITEVEVDYVNRAVKSGWVSSIGEFIDLFETEFARLCGTRYAIATSNGTTALHLALLALDVGPTDEVIVPDLSFIATANAVLMAGAKPVFADVDRHTLCMAPDDLARCLTARTRAIVPVHLYGHPAAMSEILAFAHSHGLHVIEDAAEAHGAAHNGQSVGSLGACGVFSFYGNKGLTTGEGGMVTTSDSSIRDRCRQLRDHAMSPERRYWHDRMGFNYRMTNLQAALGCAQLSRSEELLSFRRTLYAWYKDELGDANGIRINPEPPEGSTSSFWMICAEFADIDAARRDVLMKRLRAGGVDTRPYFYPMSDMPYLTKANTPVAHDVSPRGINLPTYLGLTRDDVATIASAVRREYGAL